MRKAKLVRSLCACLSILCCLLSCLPLFSGCGSRSDEPVTMNAITAVTVSRRDDRQDQNRDSGSAVLTIRATLTEALRKSYSGTVYLFELPVCFGRGTNLRGLTPVAEAPADSHLSFSLDLYDGTRTRLFSSFLLASYDKETAQYTVLTSPVAVSDPAPLATDEVRADSVLSVKGLSSPHPADAVRLGVASTVVDVSMGDIIRSDWSDGAIPFLWNGVTFYYDGEAVRALDSAVSAYTVSGIRVYLRFLLKQAHDGTPSCLYAPGVRSDAEGYLPYVADPDAARLLEAFFVFMSTRYAAGTDAPGRGLCTDFLIGRGVNRIGQNAEDGSQATTPDAHVIRYEQLVRLAYTALRAATPNGRVFISLDSHWTGRDLTDGVGAQRYLAAFRSEAALRGDFDWEIACELAASSPRVWLSSAADGECLTVTSLSSLTDLLSSETYRTPGGALRRVIVTDYTIPAVFPGEVSSADAAQADAYQAASYAYAYTVATSNERVEALIYDGTAAGAGLYNMTDSGGLRRRPIGDTFAVIDTDGAESMLSVARYMVGAAFLRAEGGQAGQPVPTHTVKSSLTVLPASQMSDKGSTSLIRFDTRGEADPFAGFASVEGLIYLDRRTEENRPVLHAALDQSAAGMPVGITTTLSASSLTGAREILLDMRADAGGGVNGAYTATVLLTRVSKGTIGSGDGTVRCTASAVLPSGSRQLLRCDMSGFTDGLDSDDTVLLTVLLEGGSPGSCDLYLREVRLVGATGGSSSFRTALIWTVLAIVTAALFACVFLLSRKSRK